MNTTRSYAAYNKDEKIRALSSSGGIFYLLAQKTIIMGGIVFGAAFNEMWQVCHMSCEKEDDLQKLMKSKYVQSFMGKAYVDIRTNLQNGRTVLYCGTPCQVEGLISYLDETMADKAWKKQLTTIDFICHGVPSPLIWRKYLAWVTKDRTITNINFRDKSKGWRDFSLNIEFSDGTKYLKSQKEDLYMRGFLQNLYLRESCHVCKFRGIERLSDFTIADFWGVHELMPDFFDDKGTSIVMTHNKKAVAILEELGEKIEICEIGNDLVIKTNTPVVRSVVANPGRDDFMKNIRSNNIIAVLKKYTKVSLLQRIGRKVKKGIQ